jgi:hypothetical protein
LPPFNLRTSGRVCYHLLFFLLVYLLRCRRCFSLLVERILQYIGLPFNVLLLLLLAG